MEMRGIADILFADLRLMDDVVPKPGTGPWERVAPAILRTEVGAVENLVSSERVPKSDAEYEMAIDQLLDELERLNDHMAINRAEIERLRRENRQLKTATRAIL